LKTFYKPNDQKEIEHSILSFLREHSVELTDIDLVITGRNGDAGSDKLFDELDKTIFSNNNSVNYKNLCGEYPTAAAFALWLAANIIKAGTLPVILQKGSSEKSIKKILICNHYLNIHHSLLLVSAC
jgi:hypothetical protein